MTEQEKPYKIGSQSAADVRLGGYYVFTPPTGHEGGYLNREQWYGRKRLREFNDAMVDGQVVKINPKSLVVKAVTEGEWNYGHEYKIPKEARATEDLTDMMRDKVKAFKPVLVAKESKKSKKLDDHRAVVEQALSEGKPVPPEVLKDYPELVKATELSEMTRKDILSGKLKPTGKCVICGRQTCKENRFLCSTHHNREAGKFANQLSKGVLDTVAEHEWDKVFANAADYGGEAGVKRIIESAGIIRDSKDALLARFHKEFPAVVELRPKKDNDTSTPAKRLGSFTDPVLFAAHHTTMQKIGTTYGNNIMVYNGPKSEYKGQGEFYYDLPFMEKEHGEPWVIAYAKNPQPSISAQKRTQPMLGNHLGLNEDYGTWANFLNRYTELREEHNGWKHYVSSNEHYIVSPTGDVHTRYGYSGTALFYTLSGKETPYQEEQRLGREFHESRRDRERGSSEPVEHSSLQSIESSRPDQSRMQDELLSNALTIDPDDPRVEVWKQHPGRMDVRGIDTPGKSAKSKTRRGRKATSKPAISLKGIRRG